MSAVPPPRADRVNAEPSAVPATEPDQTVAATEPAVAAAPPAAGAAERRAAMRALALALAAGVVGASLVLLAAGKTWSRGTASFAQTGLQVHASGSQTTALPGALALVGLASLVAVFAVRRAGRHAVAALLALSGLGAAVTVVTRRGDHGALDAAAAGATGLRHVTAQHVTTTSWPLVAVAGGVLMLVAGLLALRHGQRWPAMSGRYDRSGARRTVAARAPAPAPVDPDRVEDLWKALDRGEDPTEPQR